MKDGERLSLEQIRAFLTGSEEVGFKAANQRELYEWIGQTLCAQEYSTLGRSEPGTGDAADRQVRRERDGSGPAEPGSAVHLAIQPSRHRTAGAGAAAYGSHSHAALRRMKGTVGFF
jgi:hypothetical protein